MFAKISLSSKLSAESCTPCLVQVFAMNSIQESRIWCQSLIPEMAATPMNHVFAGKKS
jgi:hypothetical protein